MSNLTPDPEREATTPEHARLRALAEKATPGPWRWEINLKNKNVQLCGGDPKAGYGRYDLSVLDFVRWGMRGATVRFRNSNDIMHAAEDYAVVVPGREHHSDWFRDVNAPDAAYIAACYPATILSLLDEITALRKSGGSERVSRRICVHSGCLATARPYSERCADHAITPPESPAGVLTAAPMTYDNLVNCIHAAIGPGTTPYVQARIVADAIVATFPLAEREKRLVEAARAGAEALDTVCARISKASCETQDSPSEPWERELYSMMLDGLMASYTMQIADALSAYPSVDHLAEAGHQ